MRRSAVLLLVTLVLFASLPTGAQDDDAEAVVMNALAQLSELPGYHFEYFLRMSTILSDAEGVVLSTYTRTSAEGDALANGDNFTEFTLVSGENRDDANTIGNPRLRVDRTVLNGESFLNFRIRDTVYEEMFEIQPGWQSYEALIAAATSLTDQTVLNNINSMALPSTMFDQIDLITSITELEPETVSDVELRVFELRLDAPALLIRRNPQFESDLEQVLITLRMIAESDLTANYQLSIGVEDGRLYYATLEESSTIPYLTAKIEGALPYDIASSTTISLYISDHGETVEIEPVVFSD